jgi:hypothetical protein
VHHAVIGQNGHGNHGDERQQSTHGGHSTLTGVSWLAS